VEAAIPRGDAQAAWYDKILLVTEHRCAVVDETQVIPTGEKNDSPEPPLVMALSRPDRDFERICVLCDSLRPLRFIFSESTTASVRAALAIKENAKRAKKRKGDIDSIRPW
jgi:hypothetical protein